MQPFVVCEREKLSELHAVVSTSLIKQNAAAERERETGKEKQRERESERAKERERARATRDKETRQGSLMEWCLTPSL